MRVRVDEARDDRAARSVDDARKLGACVASINLGLRADGLDDALLIDDQGAIRDNLQRVHGCACLDAFAVARHTHELRRVGHEREPSRRGGRGRGRCSRRSHGRCRECLVPSLSSSRSVRVALDDGSPGSLCGERVG